MSKRLGLVALLVASPFAGGCGATVYTPRPSPRIAVVPDGNTPVLIREGRRYSVNVFGGSLEEAVSGNAEAEEEARAYKSRSVTGFVFATLGSISAGVGAGVLVGNELQANPSSTLNVASLSLVVGGLVLSIVGSVVGSGAQPHLWNAINIFNDGLPAAYALPPGYPGYPVRPGYPGYPAPPAYGPGPVPLGAAPSALPPPLPSSAVPIPQPVPAPPASTPR